MARSVSFTLGKETLSFSLGRKLTRDELYGRVKRVVEKDGKPLQRGYLTADGRLLAREQISYAKLDQAGTPTGETTAYLNGEKAEQQPSSFDEAAPLEEVPLTELAVFAVSDIYPLEDSGLEPGLYRTQFSYRKAYEKKEALILSREDGIFLLAGRRKNAPLVGQNVIYEFFDAEGTDEEETDEMDFSMF